MKMWCKDPKSGKPSATLTMLVVGFFVCIFKLLVSGVTLEGLSFETFSGVDFAAALGALGAIYGVRKYTDVDVDNKPPVEGGEG